MKMKTFEEWYEIHMDELIDEFVEKNPEDFPTDESMQDIENDVSFQTWVEEIKYADYCEEIELK